MKFSRNRAREFPLLKTKKTSKPSFPIRSNLLRSFSSGSKIRSNSSRCFCRYSLHRFCPEKTFCKTRTYSHWRVFFTREINRANDSSGFNPFDHRYEDLRSLRKIFIKKISNSHNPGAGYKEKRSSNIQRHHII